MTPNEMDAVLGMLDGQDQQLAQEAAFEWVDAAMLRAASLADRVARRSDLGTKWDRARLVATYMSAAIEVASQGIAVRVVQDREVEPEEPLPPLALCGDDCDEETVMQGAQMCINCPARKYDLPQPEPYADHACGHICDPNMVARGESVCRQCRFNPSLL